MGHFGTRGHFVQSDSCRQSDNRRELHAARAITEKQLSATTNIYMLQPGRAAAGPLRTTTRYCR